MKTIWYIITGHQGRFLERYKCPDMAYKKAAFWGGPAISIIEAYDYTPLNWDIISPEIEEYSGSNTVKEFERSVWAAKSQAESF